MKELFNAIKEKAIELGYELNFDDMEEEVIQQSKELTEGALQRIEGEIKEENYTFHSIRVHYKYRVSGIKHMGDSHLYLEITTTVLHRNSKGNYYSADLFNPRTSITATNTSSEIKAYIVETV